uniref:Uncharacterized protein n=1 Tax=Arundo donax TaxID=35708 RepID=A0A0A8YEC3_ARUDO
MIISFATFSSSGRNLAISSLRTDGQLVLRCS